MPRPIAFCSGWWLLAVLMLSLQHTFQAPQNLAEDCRVYCIRCNGSVPYATPQATFKATLEVSVQVTPQGKVPYVQITVNDSSPAISMLMYREKVTLWVNNTRIKHMTLTTLRPPLSWVTLVLSRLDSDTLLVSIPEDKIQVLTAKATLGRYVFVSSNETNRVAFNCLSGCLIREASSALVNGGGSGGKGAELRPPFTLYLNPALHSKLVLTRKNDSISKEVSEKEWELHRWHKVMVLVEDEGKSRVEMEGKEEEEKEKEEEEEENEEEEWKRERVKNIKVMVPNGTYSISELKGFNWTLHCHPQGLTTHTTGQGSNEVSTPTQTPGGETKGTGEGGGGGGRGGENSSSRGRSRQRANKGGAGAGEVAAWVLAGLGFFMVIILALALCTKTARPTHVQHLQDFPPSVGVLSYNDVGNREPEETSEPGTPTYTDPSNNAHSPHTVHANLSPHKHPLANWRAVEG